MPKPYSLDLRERAGERALATRILEILDDSTGLRGEETEPVEDEMVPEPGPDLIRPLNRREKNLAGWNAGR